MSFEFCPKEKVFYLAYSDDYDKPFRIQFTKANVWDAEQYGDFECCECWDEFDNRFVYYYNARTGSSQFMHKKMFEPSTMETLLETIDINYIEEDEEQCEEQPDAQDEEQDDASEADDEEQDDASEADDEEQAEAEEPVEAEEQAEASE